MNVTRDDLIALSGLDQNEIEAIADHEHLHDVEAAALACHLLHQPKGMQAIADMIADEIRLALDREDRNRAATLYACLMDFMAEYAFDQKAFDQKD